MIQLGMRAVIRDIQEFVNNSTWYEEDCEVLGADALRAYLLACMITAGAYEDLHDGES